MSAQKRKNLATTEDGAAYNKRPRPDFTYSREPLPDVAHLGHPDLDPEDNEAHDDGKTTSNGSLKNTKHQLIYQSNNTLFNAKIRGHGVGRGGVDADSGQKFSLPIDEANTSDDDTNAARKYLRDVRSEARGIPTVLYAPHPPNNGYDEADDDEDDGEYTIHIPASRDTGGYYDDGAYIASSSHPTYNPNIEPFFDDEDTYASDAESTISLPPQETYTTRLRTLFHTQRALLHRTPPHTRIAALRTTQPIWVPRTGKFQQCRAILSFNDPVPAQIAAMDLKSAWRLLDVCRRVLRPGMRIRRRLSAWIWALLGRLPEVGVLGLEHVSELRVLGKMAVGMRGVWDEGCRGRARRGGLLEGIYFGEGRGERRRDEGKEEEKRINGGGGKEATVDDADGDEGAAMDLESESDDGQVDEDALLAAAKSRLLRGLETSQPPDTPQDQNVETQTAAQESDLEDGEVDEEDDVPSAAVENKRQEEEEEDDTYPDVNTRVTCDMIITVVGDIFGQRDLLACREDWDG